jgi:hypothetical protein
LATITPSLAGALPDQRIDLLDDDRAADSCSLDVDVTLVDGDIVDIPRIDVLWRRGPRAALRCLLDPLPGGSRRTRRVSENRTRA